ncbi:MAG: response regulator [Bacteroidales bacterium]|nr:MAG: response regulator [Bacteroidales bacterium]
MKVLKKILVAANKSGNLLYLKDLHNNFDVEISRLNTIDEALAATAEQEFAMAIFDMQISHPDFCKVLKSFHGKEKTKSLPLIFLIEKENEQDYSIEGIECGIVDYVNKADLSSTLPGKVKIYLDLYEQKKKLEFETEKSRLYKEALKESEKKFLEIKLKSEESDKLISSFFSNLSHEIRTSLNAVVGFSNLLANENITSTEKLEYIKYINNSSIELINLIDNIIDIAKIEAGQLKVKSETVNVKSILKDLYTTLKEEINNRGLSGLELVFTNAGNKEDTIIKNDEFRLRHVMKNLLNNALKFTEKGFIEYGYEVIDKSKILFYVKDTGIGIPEDKLNVIFDRFERIENEYYTNIPGTGLGLFIVKKMVELMGGKIWVESKLNKGSRFYFELPYKKAEQETLKTKKQVSFNVKPVYNWKDKAILIAEDEYINFLYLNEILKATGIKIIWAKDGKEAVNFALQEKVDLILMDIKLPFMSGIDAFYKIKEVKPDVPVIAQTAYAMSDEKEKCLKIGFENYLVKPIERKDLMNTIYVYLDYKKVH